MTKEDALTNRLGKSIYRVGNEWMITNKTREETQALYWKDISEWVDLPTEPVFVPHDELTEGLWYLRTQVEPYYTVVSLTHLFDIKNNQKGELACWLIDEEGDHEIAAFAADQFIGKVPPPPEGM